LRSLDPESRRRMVALRDEASAVFREVVEAGRASGAFDCPHPHEAVLAIVTMCTAVAGWYRPDGPETARTLADRYAAFCLSIVGHRAVPWRAGRGALAPMPGTDARAPMQLPGPPVVDWNDCLARGVYGCRIRMRVM